MKKARRGEAKVGFDRGTRSRMLLEMGCCVVAGGEGRVGRREQLGRRERETEIVKSRIVERRGKEKCKSRLGRVTDASFELWEAFVGRGAVSRQPEDGGSCAGAASWEGGKGWRFVCGRKAESGRRETREKEQTRPGQARRAILVLRF